MKQRKAAINNNKLFINILREVMSKFDNKQQNSWWRKWVKAKTKKKLLSGRKKEKYGSYGYLKLDEIYPFQLYLQNVHNWKLCHTEGNELAHMIKDGNVVTVWYDEKLRKTCTNRHGTFIWMASI